jgi:hypothetical protein
MGCGTSWTLCGIRRALGGLAAGVAALPALGAEPGPAPAPAPVWRPSETADAVLVREKESWNRYLHDALRLPTWLDLAVEQRTRFEYLDGPFRPGTPDTEAVVALRTRLRIGVDPPGPVRFLGELQDARLAGAGPDDFTLGSIDRLDVLQLLATASARDFLGTGLRGDVHAGRMTLDFGSRRLVARNGFRNTTNAFDGVHLQLGREGAWRVRGFWARPVVPRTDTFDDDRLNGEFWGVALEDRRLPALSIDAAYFGLNARTPSSGGTNAREYQTFDLRGFRAAAIRQVDYELELIGQFGDHNGRDHSAFAGHAELGYTLDLPWTPRLLAQFDYASGTANPSGSEDHTFEPLFGARRFDLDPTGIFGPFRRANILSPGVRLLVAPRQDLKGQLKVRYWQLAQARDAFSGTGLSDPTGASGRNLGTDVELSVQWSPTPWLALDVGYDHWFKGSYLDSVPNTPSTHDSDYFYFATQMRF